MSGIRIVEAPDPARRPGDTVEVTFEWEFDQAPKRMAVRLSWYTEGKGTQDVGVVEEREVLATASGRERARFRLPASPYSFAGTLISLRWAIELAADDVAERWVFTLTPEGKEITLGAEPTLPSAFEARKLARAR